MAKATDSEFGPAPEGIEIAQVRRDPTMEAAQRAAAMDHQRRTQGGTWADMPNGQAFRIQAPHIPPSFEVQNKEALMLAVPEKMLLRPKPAFRTGPRYQWRVYKATGPEQQRLANDTARLSRAGRIRPVTKEEIDTNSPIAVYDAFELESDVVSNTLKLYEVMDEMLVYSTYKAPEDKAIANVAQLPQTVLGHTDTHDQRNAVSVKVADSRPGG